MISFITRITINDHELSINIYDSIRGYLWSFMLRRRHKEKIRHYQHCLSYCFYLFFLFFPVFLNNRVAVWMIYAKASL